MERNEAIQRLYEQALDTLIEKVKRDHWILAAVLLGSLSHDVVWEKSDIDLLLITQEGKQKRSGVTLVESGVIIHAFLSSRSEFRRMLEGSLQSSFMHSLLTKGRLLYELPPPLFHEEVAWVAGYSLMSQLSQGESPRRVSCDRLPVGAPT